MYKTAMTVDAKLRSRVAADDLALLERMDIAAMTVIRMGQRCAAAWPVTRDAAVSDLSGTSTT